MEIGDIKTKKRELSEAVREMINLFQEETGTEVAEVRVLRSDNRTQARVLGVDLRVVIK